MNYSKHAVKKPTLIPQTQALPGQVANSAGGYSFKLTKWQQMERFLILGSEGGTYYIGEKKLTADNAKSVMDCIDEDGKRAVDLIVAISDQGRAPKNDPAIFALALAASADDDDTRKYALENLPKVARIGTHLFHFAAEINNLRGWGRGLRRAIANWYTSKDVSGLAFQLVKYQQRDGYSHRDLLRQAHPIPPNDAYAAAFRWATHGLQPAHDKENPEARRIAESLEHSIMYDKALSQINAFEKAKKASKKELLKLIADFRLTREMIPTEMQNDKDVQEALLPNLGLTAVIRNLGNMSKSGLLAIENPAIVRTIVDLLTDSAALKKARVHPMSILFALRTYQSGQSFRGTGTWKVVPRVVDALDDAFYAAFGFIEPTGKRILKALDVSGSMSSPMANTIVSCREAAAAMAMVTMRIEKDYEIMGFSSRFIHLNISPKMRLDEVTRYTGNLPFECTDCSLPMKWALQNKLKFDAFEVYTDNETYAGTPHPHVALQQYRDKLGIPAKMIVYGMTANPFTIADPNDAGMLDVVGFDTSVPEIASDFIRN